VVGGDEARGRLGLAPSPRSSADRAEDFPATDPAPTSHYLKGSGGEVAGRAMGVQPTTQLYAERPFA
jgi:hypothetical protein